MYEFVENDLSYNLKIIVQIHADMHLNMYEI